MPTACSGALPPCKQITPGARIQHFLPCAQQERGGVIQPALFSIMVLMAIVTTLMTSPVFEWVYGRHARKLVALDAAPLEA
jgi:hypothetical protein